MTGHPPRILLDWIKIYCHLLLERSNYTLMRRWISGNRSKLQRMKLLHCCYNIVRLDQDIFFPSCCLTLKLFSLGCRWNAQLCILLNSDTLLLVSWLPAMEPKTRRLLVMSISIHQQKCIQLQRSTAIHIWLHLIDILLILILILYNMLFCLPFVVTIETDWSKCIDFCKC